MDKLDDSGLSIYNKISVGIKLNGLKLSINEKISVGGLWGDFNEVLQWSAVLSFQSLVILQSMEYSQSLDWRGFTGGDIFTTINGKHFINGQSSINKKYFINGQSSINIMSSINGKYLIIDYCIEDNKNMIGIWSLVLAGSSWMIIVSRQVSVECIARHVLAIGRMISRQVSIIVQACICMVWIKALMTVYDLLLFLVCFPFQAYIKAIKMPYGICTIGQADNVLYSLSNPLGQ